MAEKHPKIVVPFSTEIVDPFSVDKYTDEVHGYLAAEIKAVWDVFESESDQIFCEYVKVFHDFRPLEALLFVKNKIDQADNTEVDIDAIDFEKNSYRGTDIILELLLGYRDQENLETAIELICEYVNKKQNVAKSAYDLIINYYSINKYSHRNDYYTEKTLINVLKRKCKSDVLTKLFVAISGHFLQIKFQTVENTKGNKIMYHDISLLLSEGSREFRKEIWEELSEIANSEKWQFDILQVLNNYSKSWREQGKEIILFDQNYVVMLIAKLESCSEIKKYELYNQLTRKWKYYAIEISEYVSDDYNCDMIDIYHIFGEEYFNHTLDYEEAEKIRTEKIVNFADSINIDKIEMFVKQINALIGELENRRYQLISSLEIFVTAILPNRDGFELFVDALISYGDKIDIHPGRIVAELILLRGEEETYNFICEKVNFYSNMWKFVFFEMLSQDKINEGWVNRLIEFLKENSDKAITSSSYRKLDFLEKYLIIDSEIFIKCATIILEKREYSTFIVKTYFSLLLNKNCSSPKQIYKYFEGNKELLQEIYFFLAVNDSHIDYDGTFIQYFISLDASWIHSYAEYFFEHQDNYTKYGQEQIASCWNLKNYQEIFDCLFNYIVANEKIPCFRIKSFFSNILAQNVEDTDVVEKQNLWINSTIYKYSSSDEIFVLFEILSEQNEELRVEAIKTFVSLNQNFDMFSKLALEPNHYGGMGRMIPYMQARVKYYESLLPIFSGLDFLKHKKLIHDNIEMWKRRIEEEEVDEIIKNRFL